MTLWIIIAFLLIAITFLVLHQKHSRYYQLLDKIPSPKRAFLFGNTLQLIGKREDLIPNFLKIVESLIHYPVICVWLFHIPHVLITKGPAAEALLNNSQNIDKSHKYNLLHSWLGSGLLTSTGQKWRSHRKALTPSFHFHILKTFISHFNEESEILVSKLRQHAGKGPFDMYRYITLCTLDIICDTAMGERIHAQTDQNSEYVQAIMGMCEVVMARGIKLWLQIPIIFQLSSYGRRQEKCLRILHQFTDDVIAKRKKERDAKMKYNKETIIVSNGNAGEDDQETVYGQKRRLAFLDTLLEVSIGGQSLTDEEIREEVDTFMFEGHDTTATGICWALQFLGWCPSVQLKVHQELDRVFGNSNRPVSYEDLEELKFLECVIKESLRLVPSVPLFGRHLTSDLVIGEHTVPAGTEVFVLCHQVQTDPDIYPNPLSFDPTRFLSDDFQRRHPFSYIPFSAGPRNCIGQKFALMEEKVVLSHILRKFEITACQSPLKIDITPELILRPLNGINFTINLRQPN